MKEVERILSTMNQDSAPYRVAMAIIARGNRPLCEKVSSTVEVLARDTQINQSTVKSAIRILRREGISVVGSRHNGHFFSYRIDGVRSTEIKECNSALNKWELAMDGTLHSMNRMQRNENAI
ncbi:winged helix-turn-helix DNA-binding domain protein [Vibrio phage 1.110.O._10N.261.52.C1]|nr:winged helix-turn-helix DNA-binding domain protein [Vibrio phage 1.110.O._10N.261.52.C1]